MNPFPNKHLSLDDLHRQVDKIERLLEVLNKDVLDSPEFKEAFAKLMFHAQGPTDKPAMATPQEVKCLNLLEKFHRIYRTYLKSPLGDDFNRVPTPTNHG